MQVVLRELLKAASVFPGAPHQPVSQSAIDVSADKVIRRHDRPLIEVAAPTAQEAIEPDHLVFRGIPMPSRRCACMDASEQTFDRFPRRACAQIGAPIFSKEPADRIPEERKATSAPLVSISIIRQGGDSAKGAVSSTAWRLALAIATGINCGASACATSSARVLAFLRQECSRPP